MTTTLERPVKGRRDGPEPMLLGEKSRTQLNLVKLGWVSNGRWPRPERFARKLKTVR